LFAALAICSERIEQVKEPLKTIVIGLIVLFSAYVVLALFEAMPHSTIVIGGR